MEILISVFVGLIILALLFFLRIGYINHRFQNNLKEGDEGYVWVNDFKVPCRVAEVRNYNIIKVVFPNRNISMATGEVLDYMVVSNEEIYLI